MGRSISFIRQVIVENAPNTEIVAQTEKPVRVEVYRSPDYNNSADQITLNLGRNYTQYDVYYGLGLINPKRIAWQNMSFAYWVENVLDPYNLYLTDKNG